MAKKFKESFIFGVSTEKSPLNALQANADSIVNNKVTVIINIRSILYLKS